MPEAETVLRPAMDSLEKLLAENPTLSTYRRLLAFSQNQLGTFLTQTGRPHEAERMFALAQEQVARLMFPT